MEERRRIDRVKYQSNRVIVVCETGENYYVEVKNLSPLGMGIVLPKESPQIVGKDIIIVTETLIMYADVLRQVANEDGSFEVGISARKFTPDVLDYLFTHIVDEKRETEESKES